MTATTGLDAKIAAVREFNRFYTQHIGVLHQGLLHSPFSLTEARVMYELAHAENPTASDLARALGLDPGYLSRILAGFQRRGLVSRSRSKSDGRQSLLRLTAKGRSAFDHLDSMAQKEVAEMLGGITSGTQAALLEAMETIGKALGRAEDRGEPYILRPHGPGDIGWVVHRHGALYAQEYQWNTDFEAVVGEIATKFLRNFDGKRERCWIAERRGEIVGSVFVVRKSDEMAQLRLLLVEPKARGLGIGRRLVEECIRFARLAGYRKMMLWTDDLLTSARKIYQEAGFRLVSEEPHHSFGHDLVGQIWETTL